MFRVLSDEEAKRVTRWQAPEIRGSMPVANTRQVAKPVRLGDALAASQRFQGESLESVFDSREAQPSFTAGNENTVPLSSPSADMLQDSYDEGFARGYAEATAELNQKAVQELQNLIEALGKPALKVPDAELEQEVMALSLNISRLVLGYELETDASALAVLVRRGIEQLPNASSAPVHVYLHPLDAKMLKGVVQLPDNVDIVEDVDLKRSDCRIVSGASTVHGGRDDWLQILGAELGVISGNLPQA